MHFAQSASVPALALVSLLAVGCSPPLAKPPAFAIRYRENLATARRGFVTHLIRQQKTPDPIVQPPAGFELVHYQAPLGSFPAYVAVPAHGRAKHPAIVWIAGGFDNSIGDTPWALATPDNDQSARAFPRAGIVTMYPSLRGGNNNPGYIEGFYGEVDDVIAAGKYLAGRPDVDPNRIYLGGHSTGGTLALLTAESTSQFRAVFAFGPISTIQQYGSERLPFDISNRQETVLRSPVHYLSAIVNPVFVLEGTDAPSNIDATDDLASHCENPHVQFFKLDGLNHFSELAPTTQVVARAIVTDTGDQPGYFAGIVMGDPRIQHIN